MASSKEDQGHKDKYIDTINIRKILSQEMPMYNMKTLAITVQKPLIG